MYAHMYIYIHKHMQPEVTIVDASQGYSRTRQGDVTDLGLKVDEVPEYQLEVLEQ